MRFDQHIVIAQATQPIENPIHRASATTVVVPASQTAAPATLDTGRVFVALTAVLALILLLRWALRRFVPAALAKNARGVRVIGRTPISAKQQVLILQVGRRLLVVGDSGQQLNTLCEIQDQDEAAALVGQLNGAVSSELTEPAKRPEAPPPAIENDPALSSTRTELNGLAQRVRMLSRHLTKA